jgi:RasGEF domain
VLNNFNGVAEIVAALDSAPIYRLRKTWEVILSPLPLPLSFYLCIRDYQNLKKDYFHNLEK